MVAAALSASGGHFGPFNRLWKAYERNLRRHPVATQATTSGLLWGLGDMMAQRLERRGGGRVDKRRVALTAMFGATAIAPLGHLWYQALDVVCLRFGASGSVPFLAAKVALDNVIYTPAYVAAFFAYGCLCIDGMTPSAMAAKMSAEYWPTLATEAIVWPPIMAAIFARVPVPHQLLAVNTATLFDVIFLSWVRDQEDWAQSLGNTIAAAQQQHRVAHQEQQQKQPAQQVPAFAAASVTSSSGGSGAGSLAARRRQQEQARQWQVVLADTSPEPTLGDMALMAASSGPVPRGAAR